MNKRWVSIWFPNLADSNLSDLCQKAKQYTPVTALDEPDGLLLDVTGCEHLFGGEAGLLSKIEADFNAQVAIAPNPQAAWALSHFKPGSCVCEQDLRKILADLPIESLRLPEKTERMLDDLSINWVSELLALPRSQLLKRFGIETLRCLDRTLGAQLSLV